MPGAMGGSELAIEVATVVSIVDRESDGGGFELIDGMCEIYSLMT